MPIVTPSDNGSDLAADSTSPQVFQRAFNSRHAFDTEEPMSARPLAGDIE
jgi:hypothetical protein